MVQRGSFVGVVAPSEWRASRAAATQGLVTWTAGPALEPQADLDGALRDPDNHYGTVTDMAVPASDPGAAEAAIAAAGDAALKRQLLHAVPDARGDRPVVRWPTSVSNGSPDRHPAERVLGLAERLRARATLAPLLDLGGRRSA